MRSLHLAIDITGFPSRWLSWQDAICQETLGKVAYGFGDFEFTFTGGRNRNTGLDSHITLKSILVLRGRSPECNKRTTIPLSNAALFRRDQFMCAYCGTVSTKGLTRDHIKPLSRGGADSWLNCCACCKLSPPKTSPVECVSELRPRRIGAARRFGTRGNHQFGLRVRGRAR